MREYAQYLLLRALLFIARRLFPCVYIYCPNGGDIVHGLVFATSPFHLGQFANTERLEDATIELPQERDA